MAVSRYWRIVGVCTRDNGQLELSEARIYENGVLADAAASLSVTLAPGSGSLVDLRDGLTTGVVTWSYASYSQPGFALIWDFGPGSGVTEPSLRLGGGTDEGTYPLDLICQSSTDSVNWSDATSVVQAAFPGALTLGPVPVVDVTGDVDYAKVSLLLHGQSFSDSGPRGKAITAVGGVAISTAQSKFGGSSIYFNGSGGYVSTPSSVSDFNFGSEDLTIECHLFQTSRMAGGYDSVFQLDSSSGVAKNMFFLVSEGYFGFLVANNSVSAWAVAVSVSTSLLPSLNTWHHLAITRKGATWTLWLDGTAIGTASYSGAVNAPTSAFQIGWSGTADSYLRGHVSEFSIKKGVAKYTASFTPPSAPFPDRAATAVFLPTVPALISRAQSSAPLPERLLPAIAVPDSSVQGHLREYPFFDAYNGGIGMIYGTTKEQRLPKDSPPMPLRRRVLLIDEASRMTIRETWSDAITGNYEFRGVKQGVKYTVISYDHLHNYRAVIADNQDAT